MVTDEVRMTEAEYLALMDEVEGWKEREDGEGPWTPRQDPFEAAPDPRDVGI